MISQLPRLPDRDRLFVPDVEAGIQSCGPVGPGGWTGCMVRERSRQLEQSQWGKSRPTRKW